ncbi:MAG: hypothetical protein Q8O82_11990 [Pseudorhodobacter sp.]|nr:hypothetical protein [Pseudorhodobacter sp.]
MTWNPEQALADFTDVAKLAGVTLAAGDIQTEVLPAPHVPPTRLPAGTMAVYVFTHGGQVLKVGKVGPKSQARFTSQHYNPGSAMSTLAGSLIGDVAFIGLGKNDRAAIGNWIRANVDRTNFLLRTELGVPVLSLLESFLQCRLRPRYEGFKSQHQ